MTNRRGLGLGLLGALFIALAALALAAAPARADVGGTGWISAPNGSWSGGVPIIYATPPQLNADGSKGVYTAGQPAGDPSFLTVDPWPALSPLPAGAPEDSSIAQVLVWNRATGKSEIVSRASGATGALANSDTGAFKSVLSNPIAGSTMYRSAEAVLSSDGDSVVFRSKATNLGDGATADVFRAYVRQLDNDLTEVVSRATGETGVISDRDVSSVSVSGDGSKVGFVMGRVHRTTFPVANDWAGSNSTSQRQLYLRDLNADTTELISLSEQETDGVPNRSTSSVSKVELSADGCWAVFSTADVGNLPGTMSAAPGGPAYWGGPIYRRGLCGTENHTELVATNAAGEAIRANGARVSANGRYVFFSTNAPEVIAGQTDSGLSTYRRDMNLAPGTEGAVQLVSIRDDGSSASTNAGSHAPELRDLAISGNGRYVLMGTVRSGTDAPMVDREDVDPAADVVVRDLQEGTTVAVPFTDQGLDPGNDFEGNGGYFWPGSISDDGRWATFSTNVEGLVEDGPPATGPVKTGVSAKDIAVHAYYRDLNVEPGPPAPDPATATTGDSSDLTHQSAKVSATVDPTSEERKVFFEYGKTTEYGSTTPEQSLAAGSGEQSVNAELTGLDPESTYHYRVVVKTGEDRVEGLSRSFKTKREPLNPPTGGRDLTGGSATWGFSQAIRGMFPVDPPNNFNSSLPDDPDQMFWHAFAGAERSVGAQSWKFPVKEGSFDPATRGAQVSFGGGLRVGYCVGGFRPAGSEVVDCPTAAFPPPPTGPFANGIYVVFSELEAVIEGNRGILSGLSWAGFHGNRPAAKERRDFAALDLQGISPVIDDSEGTVTWPGVKVTLTEEGAPLGLGQYPAGTVLDPIDLTLTYEKSSEPEVCEPPLVGTPPNCVNPGTEPVETSLTVNPIKVAYGKSATLKVEVDPAATGQVEASLAGKKVSGELTSGKADLEVPALALKPGTHQVAVEYGGAEGFKPSRIVAQIQVTKAAAKVKVKPVKAKVKRGRAASFRVTASATGVTPTGKVKLKLAGRSRLVKLAKGKATVRIKLGKRVKPGKKLVTATYQGSGLVNKAKASVKVKVTK